MNCTQKTLAGVVLDPANVIIGGVTSLTRLVSMFVSAGTKVFGPTTRKIIKGFEAVSGVDNAKTHLLK